MMRKRRPLRGGLYHRNRAAGLKWCTSCKAWHPIEDFGLDSSRTDGRRAACKESRLAKRRTTDGA